MHNSKEIRRSAAQELSGLLSRATDWEESPDVKVGSQKADLLVKFKLGPTEHKLALEITSLGQPREIRQAMTRLAEIRKEMPEVYSVAVSQYISPQSAALLKRNGFGYLDLSGN